MKKILSIVIIFLAASCNTGYTIETRARIFERRVLKNGKLMVYYAFNAGKSLIQDSSIVENNIILADSVTVQFKTGTPLESNLVMNKSL